MITNFAILDLKHPRFRPVIVKNKKEKSEEDEEYDSCKYSCGMYDYSGICLIGHHWARSILAY